MKRARLKPKGSLRSRVVQEFLCNGETGKKSRVLGNCEEPVSFFFRGHRHFLKKKKSTNQLHSDKRPGQVWEAQSTLLGRVRNVVAMLHLLDVDCGKDSSQLASMSTAPNAGRVGFR